MRPGPLAPEDREAFAAAGKLAADGRGEALPVTRVLAGQVLGGRGELCGQRVNRAVQRADLVTQPRVELIRYPVEKPVQPH